MGGNFSKELKLAKSLQNICDDEGKELDTDKSAEILHKFGLLYQEKSSDKISLIQSAAFFNAACVRKPEDTMFLSSLKGLCSLVLEKAKAKDQRADLIKISNKVEAQIRIMRRHTEETLKNLENLPFGLETDELNQRQQDQIRLIRELQNEISKQYGEIMKQVADECVEIMGKPPCRYSITGMGSLARKEITPYSDFEHVIVLEEGIIQLKKPQRLDAKDRVQNLEAYEEIIDYFRWFSVIFHIIIINLKETIIRSVAVRWLNDDSLKGGDWFFDNYTTCGIKFDGMQLPACKFPLGRPWETDNKPFTVELIKPISEMVKYLDLDEDIKNGYHLADVLTKTCFVSGHREIYEEFQRKVKEKLNKENEVEVIATLEHEMNYNWKSFDAFKVTLNLTSTITCNIKSALYRSITLLISALGGYHGIDEYSCFDIIDILFKRKLVNFETAQNLQYALSISCATRLKVYMSKQGQDDFVGGKEFKGDSSKVIKHLDVVIGREHLINYFTVALSLWKTIQRQHSLDLKDFKWKPIWRFWVLFMLKFYDRVLFEWDAFSQNPKSATLDEEDDALIRGIVVNAHISKENFRKAIDMLGSLEKHESKTCPHHDRLWPAMIIMQRSKLLIDMDAYDEAIEYILKSKNTILSLDLDAHECYYQLGNLAYNEGKCRLEIEQYEKGIVALVEALNCFNSCSCHKLEKLFCHFYLGDALFKTGKPSETIEHFEVVLTLYDDKNTSFPPCGVSSVYMVLEMCYLMLCKFEKMPEIRKKRLDFEKKYQLV